MQICVRRFRRFAAGVQFQARALYQAGSNREFGIQRELGARLSSNLGDRPTRMAWSSFTFPPRVALEVSGRHCPLPLPALFMRALPAQLQRPQRGGLKLMPAGRPRPVRRTQAVSARFPAADNDRVLAAIEVTTDDYSTILRLDAS